MPKINCETCGREYEYEPLASAEPDDTNANVTHRLRICPDDPDFDFEGPAFLTRVEKVETPQESA